MKHKYHFVLTKYPPEDEVNLGGYNPELLYLVMDDPDDSPISAFVDSFLGTSNRRRVLRGIEDLTSGNHPLYGYGTDGVNLKVIDNMCRIEELDGRGNTLKEINVALSDLVNILSDYADQIALLGD